MSYYLGKLNQVDIRNKGSKNLGASNAMILMGWKAGILVAVHDAGKALLAVILARVLLLDMCSRSGWNSKVVKDWLPLLVWH